MKRRYGRSLYPVLVVKLSGFIRRPIVTSFHMSSYIADKRNKLKTKNLDKRTLYNSKSKTKSSYIKLNIVTKNSICQISPISL